jgi:hypothetical protein
LYIDDFSTDIERQGIIDIFSVTMDPLRYIQLKECFLPDVSDVLWIKKPSYARRGRIYKKRKYELVDILTDAGLRSSDYF